MDNIEIKIGDVEYTFSVEVERDDDFDPPWENSDTHGPVSGWERRDKLPGELILNSDGTHKRFYDFAEACRIALRDKWDAPPYNEGAETPKQQAAKAARADFEFLRSWCNDEWHYVGVIVTLLDQDGDMTDISSSLWGVEGDSEDYINQIANELADELARGDGVSWGRYSKETYGWIGDSR